MSQHPYAFQDSFDGGSLDCGNGLLLLIRKHIDPLRPGQLLEILSAEASVADDLPSWCRLTGNALVSTLQGEERQSFLVCKGPFDPSRVSVASEERPPMPLTQEVTEVTIPDSLPEPAPAPKIEPLSVMGVGSWPRPPWLLRALHERLEGRLSNEEFDAAAQDSVRLAIQSQERAGVDVVTDGEQRRDNYASFVGGLLDNCQLIPLTDLLPYVDHPEEFKQELDSLDVPASEVRHPAVFGPLGRSRPLAVHEVEFARTLTDRPIKVALPGPYLLVRTMWMECISDRAYADREALAKDVVRVLREELHHLLAAGAALVQFDEPVLTEVAHGAQGDGGRSFMCGALGERGETQQELEFATDLLCQVMRGLPADRLALHVCRGNWSRDESVALSGDYAPLLNLLERVPAETLVLELCTPRAGDESLLRSLPETKRIGVGVVNQKHARIESVDEIGAKVLRAIHLFGADRVLLNPDCGFATFADNPITAADVAERKLAAMVEASRRLRKG